MADFSTFSDEDILKYILKLGIAAFGVSVEERSGSFLEAQTNRLKNAKMDDHELRRDYIDKALTNRFAFLEKLRRTEIEKRKSSFALIEYEKDCNLLIQNPVRIAYIYVDPKEQKKGLGEKLVDEIKNKFLSHQIQIQCIDSQTIKRSEFFKKLGFSVVAQDGDTFVMEYCASNNL